MKTTLNQLVDMARKHEPSLNVYCDRTHGQVSIKGMVVFDTRGFAAESVVTGYLSGFIRAKLYS
jgi:hypothetical protein